MTAAAAGTYAIIAFVVGLAAAKLGRSTRAAAPLSESDALVLRTVIREDGLVHAIKKLRSLRPDMSLREAKRAASALV